jgi:addiction module HigA family antidote
VQARPPQGGSSIGIQQSEGGSPCNKMPIRAAAGRSAQHADQSRRRPGPVAHLPRLKRGRCGASRDRRLPSGATSRRDLPPIHPGEQLREEFTKPLGITADGLANDIGVPVTRVQAIIAERRGITGDCCALAARQHSVRVPGDASGFGQRHRKDFRHPLTPD